MDKANSSNHDFALRQKRRPSHTPYRREAAQTGAKMPQMIVPVFDLQNNGAMPSRIDNETTPYYSCKVFVGGLSYTCTEKCLFEAFQRFQIHSFEWPKKRGYVYMILSSEMEVKYLLSCCRKKSSIGGKFYFPVHNRLVQIIPWNITNLNYWLIEEEIDLHKCVYVGRIHRGVTAKALATILNGQVGGVIRVSLLSDHYAYPTGAAFVVFNNHNACMKALRAKTITFKRGYFDRPTVIKPYLQDPCCVVCKSSDAPYFCLEMCCFKYYCESCWFMCHNNEGMCFHYSSSA